MLLSMNGRDFNQLIYKFNITPGVNKIHPVTQLERHIFRLMTQKRYLKLPKHELLSDKEHGELLIMRDRMTELNLNLMQFSYRIKMLKRTDYKPELIIGAPASFIMAQLLGK